MARWVFDKMTNNHACWRLSRLWETLQVWRRRSVQRARLAALTELALHDIGQSCASAAIEAQKPFWRA